MPKCKAFLFSQTIEMKFNFGSFSLNEPANFLK